MWQKSLFFFFIWKEVLLCAENCNERRWCVLFLLYLKHSEFIFIGLLMMFKYMVWILYSVCECCKYNLFFFCFFTLILCCTLKKGLLYFWLCWCWHSFSSLGYFTSGIDTILYCLSSLSSKSWILKNNFFTEDIYEILKKKLNWDKVQSTIGCYYKVLRYGKMFEEKKMFMLNINNLYEK